MLIRGMGAFQSPMVIPPGFAASYAAKVPPAPVQPLPPPPGGIATALRMTGARLAAASQGLDPDAAAAAVAAAASAGMLPSLAPGSVASGAALAVAQLLPLSGAYDMPMPPPAPVPPAVLGGGGSLPSTGPAVPVGASVVGSTLYQPGPNLAALQAALQSGGYTTDDQAVAYLSSLSGQPVNDSAMSEDQAAYYLALITKKQQEAKYLKWGIAGAAVVGLALLLK